MKGIERPMAVLLAILSAVLAFNIAATLLTGDNISHLGYLVHLAIIVIAVLYIAYLKSKVCALRKKLMLHDTVWRHLPCSLAVFNPRRNIVVLTNFTGPGAGWGNVESECAGVALPWLHNWNSLVESAFKSGKGAKIDDCICRPEGPVGYVERYIVPVKNFDSGIVDMVAEAVFDITDKFRLIQTKETEYMSIIKILVNMFEIKDPYCQGHSETVSNLAQELAKALECTERQIDGITKAALLHDIGKIVIPSDILNKAGNLSAEELDQVRRHPEVGADIIENFSSFKEAAEIIRHHHERFDGRGYPEGLAGRDIPLGSRIIAVADAFEFMTRIQGPRKMDVESVLDVLIQERGRQFDPRVVDAFIHLVKEGRMDKMDKE